MISGYWWSPSPYSRRLPLADVARERDLLASLFAGHVTCSKAKQPHGKRCANELPRVIGGHISAATADRILRTHLEGAYSCVIAALA